MPKSDPDGSALLTSPDVGALLTAAVQHAGGTLVTWTLDHIDANPAQSTTATYSAIIDWAYGRREELLGVSARASGPIDTDTSAEIFADGQREVAVWIYPNDPDLPGLA
ncbi:MAG: aminoglycoside phosphotransferase family protein, partial [Actinobacteria bacterium]|nr:aminoglycoside phosphotransferase family protein [Actinomycetota bacterium]